MKIKTAESFEQKFSSKPAATQENASNIQFLKFAKGETYQFYIIPKVPIFDAVNEEVEIDYPFEQLCTHFGLYDYTGSFGKKERVNCKGNCKIDAYMKETRLPKDIWKTGAPTLFFLCYVFHEKSVKIAWFQDYLYGVLTEKLSKVMANTNCNLIDAFRYKIKLLTTADNKFDIEVVADSGSQIPSDSNGYKKILAFANQNPLEEHVANMLTSETVMDKLSELFIADAEDALAKEKKAKSAEKFEKKIEDNTKKIEAIKESFGNKPVTDDLSVLSEILGDAANSDDIGGPF